MTRMYYSNATLKARMDALVTAAGATAVLEIGTTGMSTILATFNLNNPIGTTNNLGLLTFSGFPKTASMTGSGEAKEARISLSAGGTPLVTGLTVGKSGNFDILLDKVDFSAGQSVLLRSFALSPFGSMIGTNLAGMELSAGVRTGASTRPNLNIGVPRASDFTYLASRGVSRVRLPFSWEWLQPVLASSNANLTIRNGYNPALTENGALYTRCRDWITDVLDQAAAAGVTVLLDLHNYFRYQDFIYNADGSVTGFVAAPDVQTQPYATSGTLTRVASNAAGATLPLSDFVDFWTRVATYWGNWNGTGLPHPGLGGYGLMNEPHSLPAAGSTQEGTNPEDLTITPTYMQAAINAIRAIDATTPIYVAGNSWNNAQNWESWNPGFPLTGTGLIYDAHLYLDSWGDGHRFDWAIESGLGATVNTGVQRVQPFIDWCRKYRVKGAVTEVGMPLGNDNWTTSFINFLNAALPNNLEVFTWVGGNMWSYRGYPINHIPQWYRHKTLEPEVQGVFKYVQGIEHATLHVDGSGYGLNSSLAVTPVTIRVQARGNTLAGATVTVASDNGGTFSKTTLTIPAGANKSDSFTFTPASTNLKTTLTFTVTSPTGLAAPDPFVVYSFTDPVALSDTNLPDAAMTLIAKYAMAKWVVSDAHTDFMGGAPCVDTNSVRAIADTGYMSKYDNPAEMVNWYNTNASVNSYNVPPVFGTDGNGKKYMEFNSSNSFGLWCKKVSPEASTKPTPQQRLAMDPASSFFGVVAFAPTNTSALGPLLHIGNSEEGHYAQLRLDSARPSLKVVNAAGAEVQLFGATVMTNVVNVCSFTSKAGEQRLRQEAYDIGTAGNLTFDSTKYYESILLGGSAIYGWHAPLYSARIYCAFVGVGQPTASELQVLESYASSLSTAEPAFAFGARLDGAYPNGIKPTQTNASMDASVKTIYNTWKANRLKKAPTFTATYGVYAGQTITDAYYVDSNNIFISAGVQAGCVSEGIGYGMLLTVLMAGYDKFAQSYFNGLLRLARGRPAYDMLATWGSNAANYLMDYRLGLDMSHQGGGWNAADGDEDIAYALLMAHRQWGSSGAFNYLQEAQNTIAGMKAGNFHAIRAIMYVEPLGAIHDVSRISDYMPGHFRAYKAATSNDTFWDLSRTNSYELANHIINEFSPTAKLPPGFIWKPLTYWSALDEAQPSPGGMMESSYEGKYDQNSVRCPWRWATDYLWTGDTTWGTLASQIVTTIKGVAGGDVNQTTWMYNLDGTAADNLYYDPMTVSMTMVGGMTSASHQAWVDAAWTKITGVGGYNTNYFTAELTLLGLMVASGNWWRP